MTFLIRILHLVVPQIVLFHGVKQRAGDAAVAVRITKTNVPGKLASKELTLRHYSALNFLCFPSLLLD